MFIIEWDMYFQLLVRLVAFLLSLLVLSAIVWVYL